MWPRWHTNNDMTAVIYLSTNLYVLVSCPDSEDWVALSFVFWDGCLVRLLGELWQMVVTGNRYYDGSISLSFRLAVVTWSDNELLNKKHIIYLFLFKIKILLLSGLTFTIFDPRVVGTNSIFSYFVPLDNIICQYTKHTGT